MKFQHFHSSKMSNYTSPYNNVTTNYTLSTTPVSSVTTLNITRVSTEGNESHTIQSTEPTNTTSEVPHANLIRWNILPGLLGIVVLVLLLIIVFAAVKRKRQRRRHSSRRADDIVISYVYKAEDPSIESNSYGECATSDDGDHADNNNEEEEESDDDDSYDDAASTDIYNIINSRAKKALLSDSDKQVIDNQEEYIPKRDIFEIRRSTLNIMDTICIGHFHQILKARTWLENDSGGTTDIAIKVPLDMGDSLYFGSSIIREIDFLRNVPSHRNIIEFIGCCTENDPPYLITEYSPYGNLKTYLSQNRHTFDSDNFDGRRAVLLSFAIDVANGMQYLSSLKIIHRWLAAKHVLVCQGRICKISNFSYTNFVLDEDKFFNRFERLKVPYQWFAIETLTNRVLNSKTDVWSLGVVFWEIVSLGEDPFDGLDQDDLVTKLKRGFRLSKPYMCEEEIYEVMLSCWNKKPNLRPTCTEIRDNLRRLDKRFNRHISWQRTSSSEA
ncbi:tyrosine kinase receptor Cad96Ca-like [Ptychodera flava]|uniref:tyrosine kinase receptor Cad96Ca-like n=1 Tax=Ptychodera flava TaxID=63121 RepID=UPI003969C8C8